MLRSVWFQQQDALESARPPLISGAAVLAPQLSPAATAAYLSADNLCQDLTGINATGICWHLFLQAGTGDHLEHVGAKTQPFPYIQLPPLYQNLRAFWKMGSCNVSTSPPLLRPPPQQESKGNLSLYFLQASFFPGFIYFTHETSLKSPNHGLLLWPFCHSLYLHFKA